jgi:hypothetical protein
LNYIRFALNAQFPLVTRFVPPARLVEQMVRDQLGVDETTLQFGMVKIIYPSRQGN